MVIYFGPEKILILLWTLSQQKFELYWETFYFHIFVYEFQIFRIFNTKYMEIMQSLSIHYPSLFLSMWFEYHFKKKILTVHTKLMCVNFSVNLRQILHYKNVLTVLSVLIGHGITAHLLSITARGTPSTLAV